MVGKIKFRLILTIFGLFSFLSAQNNLPHLSLVEELGCGNCHIGAQKSNIVLQRAPNLNYARLKYNEAYLFDYLSAPKKFRNNIGKSRMPNFGFSDDEAFALTKYLMIQDKLPDGEKLKEISPIKSSDGFELIHVDYQCTSCHILNNFGNKRSTDLTIAGVRLKRDWLFDFIQNPSIYVPKGSSVDIFQKYALMRIEESNCNDFDREHVVPALFRENKVTLVKRKDLKKCGIGPDKIFAHSIDTEDDYKLACEIVKSKRE